MFEIHCPYCDEKKPEVEFAYAGEAHILRSTTGDDLDDQQWSEFLFYRDNARGDHCERWWHQHGCNQFFNAVRNTYTDKFSMTYKMGKARPTKAQIKAAKNGQ